VVICIPPAIPASEQQLQCLYASQQQKLKIIACKHCSQNNKILIRDKILSNDEINAETAFTMICTEYLQETSLIPEFQMSDFYLEGPNNQNLKIRI
jgi:hypothetical protein